ncbi:MAG: hypothetical protein NZL98_10220 [Anaerolineales bacterium]|nr:hypothetical protein [Anaerolineales bacterium]
MVIELFFNMLLGLIITWILMSLTAMNLQEWLASRFRWRARMLEKTLRKMLGSSVLVDQFYNHPLIRSLFTGKDSTDKPSYIAASQFSQALMDILATTGTEASLWQEQLYRLSAEIEILPKSERAALQGRLALLMGMVRKALVLETGEQEIASLLDNVKADLLELQAEYPHLREAIEEMFDTVNKQKKEVNEALTKLVYQTEDSPSPLLNQIRAGILALSITHPQLKQVLHALLFTVSQSVWNKQDELSHIRANLEEWFENTMARLTGWYKRRVLVSTFLISFLLSLLFNVDSIHIAFRLWNQPELTQAILEQVNHFFPGLEIADDPLSLLFASQEIGHFTFPIGWIAGLGASEFSSSLTNIPAEQCTLTPFEEGQIYGLWVFNRCYPLINTPPLTNTAAWISKFLGILITAFASSQGASFWFDVLKKIINVRFSGLNPTEQRTSLG